ncbi:extracellular solute-binding protein [Albidovulum sp.]|uniref:extracellular solute-binding protein n=1 Tax=Albidovulum sp. TaxID=1872424 RepID=UPI0039B82D33
MTRFDPISRRSFLTRTAAASALLAAPTILRADDAKEITICTWETYHDDPWVAEWTDKTGIKVNVVRIGSADEMYSGVRSGSIPADLLYLDTGSFQRYVEADLIAPIDASKVANVANIASGLDYAKYTSVDGTVYGLPYNWGVIPMMFDTRVVTSGTDSWQALLDPAYAGKVILFDDVIATFPVIGALAGVADPYNLSDADFDACREALVKLRGQVRTIAKGYSDANAIFAAGDAVIGHCQNISQVFELQGQNLPFQYSFPKEGVPAYIDCSVMTKAGAAKDAAYQFVNDNMSAEWQARFIKTSHNNGILGADAAKAAGLDEALLKQTNIIDQQDPSFWAKMSMLAPPNNLDKRLALWNDFKAGTL